MLVNVLAVALTLAVIAVASDAVRTAGLSLYTEQYLAGLLAIALPLLFLYVPAGRGDEGGARGRKGPVPWYDVLLAIAGCAAAAYVAVRFPKLSELVARRPLDGEITAAVLALLILEGLRRTTGMALVYTTLFFFGLALIGGSLPGEFAARSIPIDRLTYYVIWDSTASLGVALKIVTTVVVIYTIFGHVLFQSGGSTFFTDVSMALMGRYRGGPAKIAILGSSLFGTISGNVVSNVMTVGVVTIPLMKRVGYRPHVAAAVEACASTGGQIMPPVMGIAAFIMAEFLQVPYWQVALAALIPAVLYYAALFIQVDLEAARSQIKAMDPAALPRLGAVLKAGWYFTIPFVVLIYALFSLNYEPENAGLLAIATALALAVVFPFRGRRIGIRDLYRMCRDSAISALDLFMLGAAAGIMIGTLNYSGIGFTLSLVLISVAAGSLIALLALCAFTNIILGLGLPTVGVYIVLATLVAPTMIKMGITPMAAHMFIMYYGCLSMITPPVAIASYVAANVAGADQNRTGWTSMSFGWTIYVVPFLFVYSDTLLMKGDPLPIAVDFVTAVAGVWFVSAAIMGYAIDRLSPGARAVFGITGLCLMMPVNAFAGADLLNIAGVSLALVLFVRERLRRRRPAAA
ncbi:MAG: TRAP transporter fused permease subunit [Burkholderiales bacterium]|nr:TRAP transporter fused permease subunit [Burkholderiales bacterium]